ncbi:MAG: hypothetical protein E7583_05840 [Ruminococcaceae bacterium]|nr:hypothetical protein [Oscillospiraceae bacterium]
MEYNELKIGGIKCGHVQGIAIDEKKEYMYFSCTTYLAKTDMKGRLVGTVTGIAGHLGCIAYNYNDGKVYASLEVKHDKIGAPIMRHMQAESGANYTDDDGFYIAVFDVDKITRHDMDASTDGVMTTVYLGEVTDDYNADGHRYGCSGIDGVTFAPAPGDKDGKRDIYVAYGIYSDLEREDNDYQVILRYDVSDWDKYKRQMSFGTLHLSGPEKPQDKYFVYTGNTNFGIQNLEYDSYTNCLFAAVYNGKKPYFPNYPMYIIDLDSAVSSKHRATGEDITELMLSEKYGIQDEKSGIRGVDFPLGATGMISLGNGEFLFSKTFGDENGCGTTIEHYIFDDKNNFNVI